MEKYKIGPSAQAVLDWLAVNGPATAAQVGEALYDKASAMPEQSGAKIYETKGYPKLASEIRREWARKLLIRLRIKGKVISEKRPPRSGGVVVFRAKEGAS